MYCESIASGFGCVSGNCLDIDCDRISDTDSESGHKTDNDDTGMKSDKVLTVKLMIGALMTPVLIPINCCSFYLRGTDRTLMESNVISLSFGSIIGASPLCAVLDVRAD